MFADMDEDCVFVETAKNVEHQKHMMVECIPVPKEVGDMAPIYFKVSFEIFISLLDTHLHNLFLESDIRMRRGMGAE